ncbi:hypothetical protein M2165_002679 [Variovorax sp. TBS-050B]|nr:hypothetical protein [Variovorax sp. TBS-050B]
MATSTDAADSAEGWVEKYLAHVRVERRLAARTVELYAFHLATLQANAAEAGLALDRVQTAHVRRWMAQLHGRGPRAARHRTRALVLAQLLPLARQRGAGWLQSGAGRACAQGRAAAAQGAGGGRRGAARRALRCRGRPLDRGARRCDRRGALRLRPARERTHRPRRAGERHRARLDRPRIARSQRARQGRQAAPGAGRRQGGRGAARMARGARRLRGARRGRAARPGRRGGALHQQPRACGCPRRPCGSCCASAA